MMLPPDVEAAAARLWAAIPGDAPAGNDATSLAEYAQLRDELAKLESPTSSGSVDWAVVESLAEVLLTTQSKDLLVAAYMARAAFERRGFSGLAVGLATVHGIIERYWEDSFPPLKRLRGRKNALEWLVTMLESRLASSLDGVGEVSTCVAMLEQLEQLTSARFGDQAPTLSSLRAALQRVAESTAGTPSVAPRDTPQPPSEAQAPSTTADAAPPNTTDNPPSTADAPPPSTTESPPSSTAAEPAGSATAEPPADAKASADASATAEWESLGAAWIQPIAGTAPQGSDVRFDTDYEAIRREIGKLEHVSGEPPDWAFIDKAASAILIERAKDLLCASYFAFAHYQQRGLEGLTAGLLVIDGIVRDFWEGCFPARIRGRANALEWLMGQLDAELPKRKLNAKDREAVQRLVEVAKRLASTINERFAGEGPATRPLVSAFERMLMSVPAEEKPKPPPTAAAATSSPQASATPAQPSAAAMPASTAALGGSEDATRFLVEVGKSLVQAAGTLRRENATNPLAYRLNRCGLWLHLMSPPPADAGGKTQIPGLPDDRRAPMHVMAQNAKWAEVLDEAESSFGQFRFALDLQRISAEALAGLGPAYATARTAVITELGALLLRMPTLVELAASDGSPLADDDTRTWIANEVMPSAGAGGGQSARSSEADAADAVFLEVRTLLKQGKGGEAMKLALAQIDGVGAPRTRFRRRLRLATLVLESGQAQLAKGLFAALERELRERGLVEWDPELAATCLEGLVRSLRATNKTGAPSEAAELAFERLCLIDPVAAARLVS